MVISEDKAAYHNLGPESILDAVESTGVQCDGRLLALNSYENRVYRVGIENGEPLVAKFYRPGRWSDEAIIEEHHFTRELARLEIPVVAPIFDEQGNALRRYGAYRFAVYPCVGGHSPEVDQTETLRRLGRFLGRIHLVGQSGRFAHRTVVDVESIAARAHQIILDSGYLPESLRANYEAVAAQLLEKLNACFDARRSQLRYFRIHGDFHLGNILTDGQGFHIVDFDDTCTGPAIQDIWMLLSGDRAYQSARLQDFLEGYLEFAEFDARELHLIEPLRGMRIMHYAGWIAKRWDDPAFPAAFPWFNTPRYWEEHIQNLREQLDLLDQPPLVWN